MKVQKKVTIRTVLITLCVVAVLIIGAYFVFTPGEEASHMETFPSDADALLVIVEPNITVIRDEKEILLSSGELELYINDVIKTDNTGMGYIIFSDNSTITLDTNTEIQILRNDETSESFEVRMKQIIGRTWSRVVKLTGKQADYQLETSNTIAVVRGTQFECFTEDGFTECSTHEGTVELTLKNVTGFENTVEISAGERFTNDDDVIQNAGSYDELLNYKTEFDESDSYWYELNKCLDMIIDRVIRSDKDKVLNYLKEHKEPLDCTGEWEPEIDSSKLYDDAGNEILGAEDSVLPVPTVSNVNLSLNGTSASCNWTGVNATRYSAALGSSTGSNNAGGWTQVSTASCSFLNAPLVSGTTYYCSVYGTNSSGSCLTVSSNGVYFEQASGSISNVNPGTDHTYTGSVSGNGTFANIPADHLRIKFYIKDPGTGSFFTGSSWGSKTWFYTNIVPSGNDFSFSKSLSVSASPSGKILIHYELYNHISGRVICPEVETTGINCS